MSVELKVRATGFAVTKAYDGGTKQVMHLEHSESRKLADDIYEKLGVACTEQACADSYARLSNKCDRLQEKIDEKDAEITSLIAKNLVAEEDNRIMASGASRQIEELGLVRSQLNEITGALAREGRYRAEDCAKIEQLKAALGLIRQTATNFT